MMQIEMKRIYNPVGEGSFSMERFTVDGSEYCFVFDCGSSTALDMEKGTSSFVSREIASGFDKEEVIDAVFISHFDREHMNGLEELLQKHPVKKLFLPYLEPESRLILSLRSRIEFSNASGGFARMLINQPMALLKEMGYRIGQIVLVKETGEEESDVERTVVDFDDVSGVIASGTLLQCRFGTDMVLWKLVLANFREEKRIQRFVKEFRRKKLRIPQSAQDVMELWEKHYKEVMELFMDELFEDFSTNALVVYSGKFTEAFEIEMRPLQIGKSWGKCKSFFRVRTGCMYVGDYSMKKMLHWNCLKHMYEEEWEEISVWQLPHHGALNYFRHDVAVHNAEIYIACAGTVNPFQHPSRTIVRKLGLTGKIVYWVNEETENKVVFSYKFFNPDY